MAIRGNPVAWENLYKTARWRRLRKFQLARHPLYKFCLERGIVTAANVVDRVVPHKGDWTAFVTGKLQSLCEPCRNSAKRQIELRGYRRDVGVDVGWSAPPDGLDQLDKGDIRVVSNGNDASIFKNQTVRVLAVNANYLKEHPDVVRRFMQAYRETVNTAFKDEAVLKIYADWLNISMAKAKRSRDDFYPFPALNPDTVIGGPRSMLVTST